MKKLLFFFTIGILVGILGVALAQYSEAPSLEQRVAAGELPPVEERLPQDPLEVPIVERIGEYGGTWRTVLVASSDTSFLTRTIGYENLMRWTPDANGVIPNLADSFEVSEDGTTFTFKLRDGVKWSDGTPFTSSDIMFWYEDVLQNEDLTPSAPSWLINGGELVQVTAPDETTVVFTFAEPNGFFLDFLAMAEGIPVTGHPRHYLKQFHASYNETDLAALVAEGGYQSWADLFAAKAAWGGNSEMPVLFAWEPTIGVGESTTQFVAERNPYYWKVDAEGHQLPYIDQVIFEIVAEPEVALLKALNGELSLPFRVNTLENKSVFFDNMEASDYHFVTMVPANMNEAMISLNLTHPDPVKREIYNNKDFRIGLSHAINRQEIIDLVYVGQGRPWQGAPYESTPYYNEALATQYTEYDPELANEYLDKAGFAERDGEGFRLGPDGKRITIVLEASAHKQTRIDVAELAAQQLKEVGIDMQVRVIDRSLQYERKVNNEHDATIWTGQGGLTPLLNPNYYFPYNEWSEYGIGWAAWYNGDPAGIEPPEVVKEQMALYDEIKGTVDPDKQLELAQQLLATAQDQFYAIGVTAEAEGYQVVKNNFHNVPEVIPDAWTFLSPALTNPEQYFITQP